jgi:hypothetical protein
MLFSRSRVDEANPVVTGRADEETANVVFPGWRGDEALQRRANPFVELHEARASQGTSPASPPRIWPLLRSSL